MIMTRFLTHLRAGGLKVSLNEFLSLLEALSQRVIAPDVDEFYLLARTILVKNESAYDRFDQLFASFLDGVQAALHDWMPSVPDDWLQAQAKRLLTDDERAAIDKLGSFEELMAQLKERLAEQHKRHQGGNRFVGTGGTSPFGNSGYHPEGVRIGGKSTHRRAVKVWEQRQFADLNDQLELNTRNFKVALRRLRRFAREGAAEELAVDDTISATAKNAGWLDLKFVPERHNAIKVLLCLDVGGSMDDHIRVCEELFSAARAEFKHLEHYYFHNCVYERLWRSNARNREDVVSTHQLLHTYGSDYRLIFVGDASMNPYELLAPGASVEHHNPEAGVVWMRRLLATFPHAVWINPVEPQNWDYVSSLGMLRELMQQRMFPLTLDGLSAAIEALRHPKVTMSEPQPA